MKYSAHGDAFASSAPQAHADPRIDEGRECLRRRVPRGVVDDDDLEVAHRLPENALERRADERLAVVHGDEDGDERRAHDVS